MNKILILMVLVGLLGCGREKSEVVVLGIGIEKNGSSYVVHAEVGQRERVKEEKTIRYVKGEGDSLELALGNMFEKSGSDFYFSHVQVIAMSSMMIRELDSLQEVLEKYSEIPFGAYLVVSTTVNELFSNEEEHQAIKLSQLCEYREEVSGVKMSILEDVFLDEDMMLFSFLEFNEKSYEFTDRVLLVQANELYEISSLDAFLLGSANQRVDSGIYEDETVVRFNEIYTYLDKGTLYIHGISNERVNVDLMEAIEREYERVIHQYYFVFDEEIENVELNVSEGEQ